MTRVVGRDVLIRNTLVLPVLCFELFGAIQYLLFQQLQVLVYLYFNKILELLMDGVRFIELGWRVHLLTVLKISEHFG